MRIGSMILVGALFVLSAQSAGAHVGRHLSVIVDTDAALDDIRALGLLLQCEEVDILSVVTSDGACAPEVGTRNVRAVLRELERSYIPVAPGRRLDLPPPSWREMSESLGWSDNDHSSKRLDGLVQPAGQVRPDSSTELIGQVLRETTTEVIYICLGPMTNLAAALKADTLVAGRLAAVYYSGSTPQAEPRSWNTARDLPAAENVFAHPTPIIFFQVADSDLLQFDQDLWETVCSLGTPVANLLCRVHGQDRVRRLVESNHFRCWDEMVVLGLLYPELRLDTPAVAPPGDITVVHMDRAAARNRYLSLLQGVTIGNAGSRAPVVLKQYPTDPELLQDDIRSMAAQIIERYGLEEWNAALLANEFHRHLGIYSLIGVKMGIRAREILGAGLDDLQVVSRAGSGPPLSCLNDGLQVATGASLGRGTISIEANMAEPSARFIKGKTELTLCLKPDLVARIRSEVQDTVRKHGQLTPAYWRAIRTLALGYWLEMDRRRIFDEISRPQPLTEEVLHDVVAP